MLLKNKKACLLKTICKSDIPIEKMWFKKNNNQIYNPATLKNLKHSLPDQSLNQSYHQNGCVDVIKIDYFKIKTLLNGKIIGYEMKHNFDINTYNDYKKLLKTRKI